MLRELHRNNKTIHIARHFETGHLHRKRRILHCGFIRKCSSSCFIANDLSLQTGDITQTYGHTLSAISRHQLGSAFAVASVAASAVGRRDRIGKAHPDEP